MDFRNVPVRAQKAELNWIEINIRKKPNENNRTHFHFKMNIEQILLKNNLVSAGIKILEFITVNSIKMLRVAY